jgi:hypothetical protein
MALTPGGSSKVDLSFVSAMTKTGVLGSASAVDTLLVQRNLANFPYGSLTSQISKQFYETWAPGTTGAKTYTNGPAGTIVDQFGNNLTFGVFKIIYVYNSAAVYLTINGTGWLGGATSTVVGPSGSVLFIKPDGYSISNSQTIILTPFSGNLNFDIALLG